MSEMYKITSYSDDGLPVTVYARPEQRRIAYKMMMQDYGNAEEEQITEDQLPDNMRTS